MHLCVFDRTAMEKKFCASSMLPQLHSGEPVVFEKQVKIQRATPGSQPCIKYLGFSVSAQTFHLSLRFI